MVIIDSARILLRSWKDEDLKDLIEGLNNIQVSKWLAGVPYPYTEEHAKGFLSYAKWLDENGKDIMLAIVLKENNKVIGGTSIESINLKDETAGGGIKKKKKYQRNGYGIEAFSARIKYAFEVLGLRRMENGYFPGNVKSKNMQHKLGYQEEGIRRKRLLCLATKEYTDECITGLLKEEFVAYQES